MYYRAAGHADWMCWKHFFVSSSTTADSFYIISLMIDSIRKITCDWHNGEDTLWLTQWVRLLVIDTMRKITRDWHNEEDNLWLTQWGK